MRALSSVPPPVAGVPPRRLLRLGLRVPASSSVGGASGPTPARSRGPRVLGPPSPPRDRGVGSTSGCSIRTTFGPERRAGVCTSRRGPAGVTTFGRVGMFCCAGARPGARSAGAFAAGRSSVSAGATTSPPSGLTGCSAGAGVTGAPTCGPSTSSVVEGIDGVIFFAAGLAVCIDSSSPPGDATEPASVDASSSSVATETPPPSS